MPQTPLLDLLYDRELFEAASRAVAEETNRYLERCQTAPYPALKPFVPSELAKQAGELLDRRPEAQDIASLAERARELTRSLLDGTNPLQSTRYMGHQVPPPVPYGSAFSIATGLANPGTAVFEMAPSAVAAERALSERLGRYIGWEKGFDSIATNGGSLANLTAILTARNVKYPDFWTKGSSGGRKPAILSSRDAHYSIARAAGALGLGTESVIPLELDFARRADPAKLEDAFEKAVREGFDPFCIVASSCSTPVGAFDALGPIADFATRRGLWLHVDAAHGGGLLLSRKYRKLLAGIERADSVVWDAHKMMFVPALATFVFYKDAAKSYATFAQEAPYLFKSDDSSWSNPGLRTLECTRGPTAVVLWALWSTFGPEAFETLVDRVIDQAKSFHALLSDSPDFEPANDPECNIVCFRHLPEKLKGASAKTVSDFQHALREALLKAGTFYITGTKLDGNYVLRTTIMNPRISEDDLKALMDELRRLGRQIA